VWWWRPGMQHPGAWTQVSAPSWWPCAALPVPHSSIPLMAIGSQDIAVQTPRFVQWSLEFEVDLRVGSVDGGDPRFDRLPSPSMSQTLGLTSTMAPPRPVDPGPFRALSRKAFPPC